jgi:hypothetical protein
LQVVRNKIASPSPSALIESMRNLGYDLPSALADIIDNSITAEANQIHIDYGWNDGEPYVLIIDNGNGMSEEKLVEAMTPGKGMLEKRELDDLGRFGLGLKTASWSQCKRMTAYTKHEGSIHHLTWDLDHVREVDEWELLGELEEYEVNILNEKLNSYDSGTAILWTNLDRILPEKGDDETKKGHLYSIMIELVIPHLSMIFHRYIEKKAKLEICVGMTPCKPWDPFLSAHRATEESPGEPYEDEKIIITPFVLPHTSKLTTAVEKEEAEGVRGWDANQGFFVYRRNRMIISGGYFDLDLKSNASYRLCRIKVDLTNEFDLAWKVDVRKKDIIPPPEYREQLRRIAKNTMNRSSRRYVARTHSKTRLRKNQTLEEVWQRKQIGEKIQYKINSDSPGIQAIINQNNLDKKVLKQLLYIIERTIPYRSITLDNNEMEDATMDLPQENIRPPEGLQQVALKLIRSHVDDGMSTSDAIDIVTQQILPSFGADFRVGLEDEFKGEL